MEWTYGSRNLPNKNQILEKRNDMKRTSATTVIGPMLLFLFIASLAIPVYAGPNFTKYVSPLKNGADDRFGQVIYMTNPEDDGTFELEVEIEEYMPFAESTVNVKLDGTLLGTIDVDELGNGKLTFYVSAFNPASNIIEVTFSATPTPAMLALRTTTDDFHMWVKGPGKK